MELLCDRRQVQSGRSIRVSEREQLSALNIRGVNLAVEDFIEVDLRAELLDGGGIAIETVRVVGLAAFLVLKARAYGDRGEQKDAYDLIFCLEQEGPESAAVRLQMGTVRTDPLRMQHS